MKESARLAALMRDNYRELRSIGIEGRTLAMERDACTDEDRRESLGRQQDAVRDRWDACYLDHAELNAQWLAALRSELAETERLMKVLRG